MCRGRLRETSKDVVRDSNPCKANLGITYSWIVCMLLTSGGPHHVATSMPAAEIRQREVRGQGDGLPGDDHPVDEPQGERNIRSIAACLRGKRALIFDSLR